MSAPAMVSVSRGPAVMSNALAPALKLILSTVTSSERLTERWAELPKLAISDVPLGTVAGNQFAAVFQSPELGFVSQVALPAKTALVADNMNAVNKTKTRRVFMPRL